MFGFNAILSSGGISEAVPMIVIAVVAILFAFVVLVASRYKKCPSDKIMVIYGQV
jgi:flotillin